MPATELQKDLVLVGGGHTHALAMRMLAMDPIEGLRITLISAGSHTPYSGMLPGLVAGHYQFEQTHIDLARLCQWAGVRFICAQVTSLDPGTRTLTLAGRPAIQYDIVSIDIGSQPELDSVPGARAHAVPVKPVARLCQRWEELRGRIAAHEAGRNYRIALVGGGSGSVELALAMAHTLAAEAITIDLWCGSRQILQNYNSRARRCVMSALARHQVAVHTDSRVGEVEEACLVMEDGSRHVYDELFWCTGAAPAPWIAATGLSTDTSGFLAVRDTLQSPDDERVFGCGDIATQIKNPRPKAGVYAVRQGPVLAHNLRALLMDKPLREHKPQMRFLSLVSLGDKQAAADKGPFSASGSWVWHWKDRIDREFMGRFESLPPMPTGTASDSLPELDSVTAPHCGGCGAKIGANALSLVLAELAQEFPDNCQGQGDDASAIPHNSGEVLLQSIDVLRQLTADHYLMGRIAANHALSDLYACGARPLSALAAITLPFSTPAILQRDLKQVLAGALHEFSAVDCTLTGGHSMQGPELSIGFVVNGQLPQDKLLAKKGAKVDDQLILTKPLGTGILFSAHMQQLADGRHIEAALQMMLQNNFQAGELASVGGASACTDITGFGLLGHLLEMLGNDRGAELRLDRLPVLEGVTGLIAGGVASPGYAANAEQAYQISVSPGSDPYRRELLFDPQTSGGLLIAVPAEQAANLQGSLRAAGYGEAVIIGEVVKPETGEVGPKVACH